MLDTQRGGVEVAEPVRSRACWEVVRSHHKVLPLEDLDVVPTRPQLVLERVGFYKVKPTHMLDLFYTGYFPSWYSGLSSHLRLSASKTMS